MIHSTFTLHKELLIQWIPALPSCVNAGFERHHSKLTHYQSQAFVVSPAAA